MVAEVPLANCRVRIPRQAQIKHLRDRDLGPAQRAGGAEPGTDHVSDSRPKGVATGHDARAGRRADRVGPRIAEQDATCCQGVDVGRGRRRGSLLVRRDDVDSEIVGDQDENVVWLRAGVCCGQHGREDNDGDNPRRTGHFSTRGRARTEHALLGPEQGYSI